ncbi:hypothetical protein [Winogradskyella sp.]|uniref:hypothetical protein n=1 Tax=Winogradskyella sp. TaxID=1883156 RepID=UPI0025FD6667|nr:hypothetical protein [Winogradskyella sp.]
MKKLFITLLFLGFYFTLSAQSVATVGDELVINEMHTYTYIKFPKPNILIKRGKVANYKSVYGNTVVIDEVITKDNGSTYVILKKKDGSKFFGYLAKVKVNYDKAIEAKEITVVP